MKNQQDQPQPKPIPKQVWIPLAVVFGLVLLIGYLSELH